MQCIKRRTKEAREELKKIRETTDMKQKETPTEVGATDGSPNPP